MVPIGRSKDGKATLRVHVQPRATKNRFCGLHDDAVKLAVKAPPVEGKANRAVGDYLAEILGVSRKSVVLVSGHQARKKVFCLGSLSENELQDKVETLLRSLDDGPSEQ